MDAKKLEAILSTNKPGRIQEATAYYMGKHPPILQAEARNAPDFRVSVPLIRIAVDNMAGYMAKPGAIVYEGETYETLLKPIYDANEEPIITNNLFKKTCIAGVGYEVHWMENSQDQFAIVPSDQGIPVYSADIRPKLIQFVWHRESGGVEIADVYDALTVERWTKGKGGWAIESVEEHGYGQVPIVVYKIDYDGMNLFDHVRELQDLIDRLVSHDMANESEKLANAILALANRLDQDQIDNIKQAQVMDGLGSDGSIDSKIKFVTKELPSDYLRFVAETAERLLYDCLQIPNPNDENFASGASGIAQAYKLLGFEYKCSSIEANFMRGLQDRARLIAGHEIYGAQTADDLVIRMVRNLPFDLQTYADTAAKLAGTWDIEAILNIFPDHLLSKEAKARIIKAKAEAADAMVASFEAVGQDDDQDDDNQDDNEE